MADFNLQEEILSLADLGLYQIQHELDVDSMRESEVDAALGEAIESVVQNPESVSNLEVFDVYRSLLKHSEHLSASLMNKLLDSITSSLQTSIDLLSSAHDSDDPSAPLAYKQPLEMWAFLISWFVQAAEKHPGGSEDAPATSKAKKGVKAKKTASTGWNWQTQIPYVLQAMHKALRMRTDRVWTTTQERDALVGCFTRPAYQIAETEAYLKANEVRLGVYKVICLAVKFHGHGFGAQTSIMQNLTYFEHLSEPMAELLAILEKEFDYTQLTEEVLREISTKRFSAQDAKGPRSFSRFLIRLAELSPRLVLKQMSLLLTHLDSEAHPMRMAIVEIIGLLIKDISDSDDGDEDQKKKQIKKFFELLMERYLDLNSWVRCKVLTTLIKLCDLPTKFPKQRHTITELTIRSLEDKTSSARRYSIQLLCKLLETHPFGALHGGTLNLAEWQERHDKIAAELEKVDLSEMEKARADAGEAADGDEDDDEEDEDDAEDEEAAVKAEAGDSDGDAASDAGTETPATPKPTKVKKQPRKSQPNMAAVAAEQSQAAMDGDMILKLRLTKKYYADALRFINQIEDAIPTLSKLLISTNKTEVLESMRFFRTAYEYNVQSADVGIKTMLHLIWTKDNNSTAEDGAETKGVRANLIDVYRSLYFDVVPDLTPKQQVNRIAKNMIERTYSATLAELTSLEELMRTMMLDNGIHNDVINKLWQVYGTEQEIPRPQRQGAIIILGMLALAKRDVVTERVELLLKIGLGPLGKADLVLARYTCIALQRLSGSAKKVKGSLNDKTMRLPMDSPVFAKLQDIIESSARSPQWFGTAEQALNTIYLLGEQPDALCGNIIKNLTNKVFNAPKSRASPAAEDVEMQDGTSATDGEDGAAPEGAAEKSGMTRSESQQSVKAAAEDGVIAFHLAQLVFVVGHVAIKHIVYLELVEREFKRRKDETAKEKAASKPADKDGNDLDAVAGNAEDDIGDLIANVKERELLYGEKSLLAIYGPLVAHICATPRKYPSPSLRQAAVLSLTKLMCVSAQFCESHLLLLFKILETSRDPTVRSNIVIALGDIAVCFGSMIDDNSDRLYQGLTDKDVVVKKNTLMVLTHLILNGMIKVKGQLGEMAKCLEDEDPRISDLAKLFFTQLSTKDNALYNNLQDVISHLSIGSHAVDEEMFERTMRFIFTFIDKDKQAESIIEKLCQRFRLATDPRQWRDISMCLSLLPFKSERSVKKLIEGLPFYQDKLHEETVFRRFSDILAKARSNKQSNKPETELNEFEAILAEHSAKGAEDAALEADVAKKTKQAKKRAAARSKPAAAPARRGGRRKAVVESDEEEED